MDVLIYFLRFTETGTSDSCSTICSANASDIFASNSINFLTIDATVLGVLLIVVAVILAVLSRLSKRISDMKQRDLY